MVDDAFGFDFMGILINKARMKSDMHQQQLVDKLEYRQVIMS